MKKHTWIERQKYDARRRKGNEFLSMLEKSKQPKYAYKGAMLDIQALGGTDRFLGTSETDKFFNQKMNALENFLSKATSSPRKYAQVGKQTANTLNKKFPSLGFTPDNIDAFFDSKMWEELRKSYASDTILKGIGKMKQEMASIKKQLELPFGEYHMTDKYRNVPVREFVEDMVNKYGYSTVSELYSGFGYRS